MTLHRWRVLELTLANEIAASNAELAAAKTVREKEATDYSKSEAELVEVADTVKRAISERM